MTFRFYPLRRFWLGVALSAVLWAMPVAAENRTAGRAGAERATANLAAEIDQILGESEAAFWGAYVQDLASGQVLYQRHADHPFLPASNQKILTTSTALDALGADHRFETTLYFSGEADGSVLSGDLVLSGSGDPTFGSSEMRASALHGGADPLRAWAERLAAMGVTAIRGRLIGDDDVFDNRPYAEGWDVDYVTSQSSRLLGVSTGGLAYRDNLVRVQIRAGRPGQAPRVAAYPEGVLTIRNRATTSRRRRGRSLDIERAIGTERITLTGSVPQGYRGTVLVPATDPTRMALRSFRQALAEAGINVSALEVVDVDDLSEAPETDEAQPLFVHLSPPLAEILAVVNKESNNFYADQLFRTYGYGGSADGSENRIKALLERAGADGGAVSIRDGSGLSRKDLITPRAMVQLLAYMAEREDAGVFLSSLPAGGEAGTTLRYRLKGVPVRAKTGSLEFARALSGYATTADGREVAFALFANNYSGPSYRVTQTMDRIVRAIAAAQVG